LPPLLDDNDERTKSTSANITSEILQIISGAENITNFVLQHYLMTQATMDVCLDFVDPFFFGFFFIGIAVRSIPQIR
jgi:hypothetical protein